MQQVALSRVVSSSTAPSMGLASAPSSPEGAPPGLLPLPQPPQRLVVSDVTFAAYMEDCVLSDFAIVAAGHGTVQLTPRSQIRSWDTLNGTLCTLGFRSEDPDAWVALGIVPTRTTKEQTTAVQRRLELARTVLSLAHGQHWPATDAAQADAAANRLTIAADTIQRELISTGTRRGHLASARRLCQELGSVGLNLLDALRQANTVIGTQCSNHLGLTTTQLTGTLPVEEASAMWLGLCSSSSDALWGRLTGKDVVIWSPATGEEIGRLLGGFVRHLGQGARATSMRLVCPIDDLPGCTTPTAILQHWAHPGLGERWAGILAKVEFLVQPLEQISPGGRFAQVVWRSVGLLTFRHGAVLSLPTTLSIEEPWQQVASGLAIHLDFPTHAEVQVVAKAAAVTAVGWRQSEPRRSPASQKHAPRLRMTLYSGEASCAALDAAVFAHQLHRLLSPLGGMAAQGNIFMDDTALIMATTGPEAFTVAGANCMEILLLNVRAAVIRTQLDEMRWEEDMRAW